jgi:NADH dehydrogenase FAD-containing subunit
MKKQVIVIGNGFASMFFIPRLSCHRLFFFVRIYPRYDITVIENGKLIYFPSIRCFGLW